ncbi:MAG: ABC transporter ATP-binding protein [Burkholderiaceae bacterium]
MVAAQPILSLENVNAWYGASQALFDVSLDLDRGETVCILGRNGAGKSTTLRSVVGLIRRRTGRIVMNGRDLLGMPIHHIARTGIGYVPEERGIFTSLSVDENLYLPPTVSPKALSLNTIYDMFPNLAERRGAMGGQLSGGEQQMLAIARVLRTGAELLLLDEPTEGLAPVIIQRIGELLQQLRSMGHTILLVEQNYRFAHRVADRFYVLENGRIVNHLTRDGLSDGADSLSRFVEV